MSQEELDEVFDDLASRFLWSLPESDFASKERLLFMVEKAAWFYDDEFRDRNPALPKFSFKDFAVAMFRKVPVLAHHIPDIDQLVRDFRSYKSEVPTAGAALLAAPDNTAVLLVRHQGKSVSWGFPKGKIGKDEAENSCARREVLEEVGFDIGSMLSDNTYYMDSFSKGRNQRIYVIPNVPVDFQFMPQTKGEIGEIRWHPLSSIPNDSSSDKGKKYWNVHPYLSRLKAWAQQYRDPSAQSSQKRRKKPHQQAQHRQAAAHHPAKGAHPRGARPGTHDGLESGGQLTDHERSALFEQYVADTQRRLAEDSSVSARHHEMQDMLLDNHEYMKAVRLRARKGAKDLTPKEVSVVSFRFDREPILACFS